MRQQGLHENDFSTLSSKQTLAKFVVQSEYWGTQWFPAPNSSTKLCQASKNIIPAVTHEKVKNI